MSTRTLSTQFRPWRLLVSVDSSSLLSRDKNEGPVIVMKESPVAGSLLSSLDVGDAAPSMHPNA